WLGRAPARSPSPTPLRSRPMRPPRSFRRSRRRSRGRAAFLTLGSSFAWLGRGIIRRPAGLRTARRAPGQQEPASSSSPDVPKAVVDLREELVHRQRLDEDAPADRLLGIFSSRMY